MPTVHPFGSPKGEHLAPAVTQADRAARHKGAIVGLASFVGPRQVPPKLATLERYGLLGGIGKVMSEVFQTRDPAMRDRSPACCRRNA
jgi:hypothetical protein